jgi:hypothetical protein
VVLLVILRVTLSGAFQAGIFLLWFLHGGMKMKKVMLVLIGWWFIVFCSVNSVQAADSDAMAQANNPLANMVALNLHNYYIGEYTGMDEDGNQFWLRYAQPFSIGKTNWLMRASLPVNSFPFGMDGASETGLGDFNILAAYLFDTGNPSLSLGIGPMLNAPTASEDVLGSEKWAGGLAHVLFDASSKKFQYGYLLTWMGSFAGEDDRDDVNIASFQYFAMLQLGGGWYLRSTPIWAYNFENDTYSIPLGLGVGKVIPTDKVVLNVFVEPQVSIADDGRTWPDWQVFAGLNFQFKM